MRVTRTVAPAAMRGQAITECVVSAGMLVSFFLGILYLGKLHDLQSAVVQSGRQPAFQSPLVGPQGAAAAARQGVSHLLTWQSSPVLAADSLETVAREVWHPALGDHSGRDTFWPRGPAAQSRVDSRPLPGFAGQAVDAQFVALAPATAISPPGFDLSRKGWLRAEIATILEPGRAASPWIGLARITLRDHTVVAGDDWSSVGPAKTASRVAGLTPAAGSLFRNIVGPALSLAQPLEPSLAGLCIGRVDPEVVPGDRLALDPSALRGTWRPECRQ